MIDLEAIEARANAATPGPWQVWDGHGYCGGGRDLCIGAGEEWLANMDHRECSNADAHNEFKISEGCTPECKATKNCNICELDGEITAEQDGNAQFIAHARTDIPALIAEIRLLRSQLNDARDASLPFPTNPMPQSTAEHPV